MVQKGEAVEQQSRQSAGKDMKSFQKKSKNNLGDN